MPSTRQPNAGCRHTTRGRSQGISSIPMALNSWMPASPGGFLAIIERVFARDVPWASELAVLIRKYLINQDFQSYDVISEIAARGLFHEKGRQTTSSVTFRQSVGDYIESFHSRNGSSRQKMSQAACRSFDSSMREVLAGYCPDGIAKLEAVASIVWGLSGT